ncbi:hypothetical protein [Amycolatopsis anabasis]|uniref:hypothetical protein n=1 Tax=Amycolatopsis anabasis TaxID=1840409 RepID=UPI00131B9BC3|nr:hypothetical protein [Amycolatopsis anabasis]
MLLVNPGSGPFPTGDEGTASVNMDVFVADVCDRWNYTLVTSARRPEKDGDDGRYTWDLEFLRPNGQRHRCEVRMFGVPRDYGVGDNPLAFPEPRLYVDGQSWVWDFAVSSAAAGSDQELEYLPSMRRRR